MIMALLLLVGLTTAGQTQLVLYPSGLALVEETRHVTVFEEGELELSGFPTETQWETVLVEGVEVVQLRPISPKPWSLSQLLGRELTVQTQAGTFRGILREIAPEGLVLDTAEGVVVVREYLWLRGPDYEPIPSVQAVLAYRAREPGEKALRFRYLTGGLSWTITYEAQLQTGALHIWGKAILRNDTGVEFAGAKLTLIAGEVRPPAKLETLRVMAAPPEALSTEVFEYHRYDIPGLWDLPRGEILVPLVSRTVPATQFYRLSGDAVEAGVRFTPEQILPAGEMRVYAEGIFVGASSIPHLPKGKSAELVVGYAFDLTGKHKQVKRERIGENLFRDTWRITLRSAKKEEVQVEVIETLSSYWRILHSTLPYEILDAQRVKFVVPVVPEGETSLEYTVEWSY
ncbi:MAG: DUF4139 domain-containing protein [Candidatus Bipolaricaulaceae bacterium]